MDGLKLIGRVLDANKVTFFVVERYLYKDLEALNLNFVLLESSLSLVKVRDMGPHTDWH